MGITYAADPVYALGRTAAERSRLMEQDRIYGPLTSQLLVQAGIGPGMRVLDLGCGVGDVSIRLADLVGPSGAVVGVDADPLALETARQRAGDAGIANVSFVQGDLRELAFDAPFDAAAGRLILLYLGDPAAALRRVGGYLRPGGLMAFQEFVARATYTQPSLPLVERSVGWILDAFRGAGMDLDVGLKLPQVFHEAGLPAPTMRVDTLVMTGPDSPMYQFVAHHVRSVLPFIERFGIATAQEVGIETLAQRLRDEVVAARGAFLWPPLVGAWARRP